VWKTLNSKQNVNTSGQSYAIVGMGGIGKTQLALAYAYEAKSYNFYDLICWIHSEKRTNIIQSYQRLLKKLDPTFSQIQLSELEDSELVGELRSALAAKSQRWLLIYDNLLTSDDLDGLKPSLNGHILITSRSQIGWDQPPLHLNIFSENEAVELFFKKRGYSEGAVFCEERNLVLKIAEKLGYLPLALSHAVSYIERKHDSLLSYLEKLEKRSYELLLDHPDKILRLKALKLVNCDDNLRHEKCNEILIEAQRREQYPYPVSLTLSLSLEHLMSLDRQILSYLCYFNPENIPTNIFKFLLMNFDDISLNNYELLMDSILKLSDYSIIQYKSKQNTISVHRLVQRALQHPPAKIVSILTELIEAWFKFCQNEYVDFNNHSKNDLYQNYKVLYDVLIHIETAKMRLEEINTKDEIVKTDIDILRIYFNILTNQIKRFTRNITLTLVDAEGKEKDNVNLCNFIKKHLKIEDHKFLDITKEISILFDGNIESIDLFRTIELFLLIIDTDKIKQLVRWMKEFVLHSSTIQDKIDLIAFIIKIDIFEEKKLETRLELEQRLKNNQWVAIRSSFAFKNINKEAQKDYSFVISKIKNDYWKSCIVKAKFLFTSEMSCDDWIELIEIASKTDDKSWEIAISRLKDIPRITKEMHGNKYAKLIKSSVKMDNNEWSYKISKITQLIEKMVSKRIDSFDPIALLEIQSVMNIPKWYESSLTESLHEIPQIQSSYNSTSKYSPSMDIELTGEKILSKDSSILQNSQKLETKVVTESVTEISPDLLVSRNFSEENLQDISFANNSRIEISIPKDIQSAPIEEEIDSKVSKLRDLIKKQSELPEQYIKITSKSINSNDGFVILPIENSVVNAPRVTIRKKIITKHDDQDRKEPHGFVASVAVKPK
jgi:hypothetical protein